MFWTILALIFLVVLGGFVSYYGDLQGRRWGKKRVSLFGLRPKHTAILITTLTGSVIVILSAAAIMAAVPNVREVVLRGEHAIRDNKRILAESQKIVAENEKSVRQSSAQVKQAKEELAVASREVAEKKQEISALKQQYQALMAQNADLVKKQSEMTAMIKQEKAIQLKLNKENHELAVWNKNAGEANKDLGLQNIDLMQKNLKLTRDNEEKSKTNTDLQKDNANLLKRNEDLASLNDALYNQSKNKALEVQGLNTKVSELNQKINQLTQQRSEMMDWIQQREELFTGTNKNILQNFAMVRRGRLNIRADSELARLTIAPHLRPEAVRNQLVRLLLNASDTARKLGAAPDISGREVRIVTKQLVTLTGFEKADENASLDALADNLSGRDKPVVVIANAVSNSVVGEVVFVELRPYQIDSVYSRGEKVAARRIDARQQVDKIIENLIQFLQKDVREAAIKAGMLPRIDPETGMPEIGIIGTADLFQLTERVRKLGGDVLLTATAKQEVSSSDPLNLEFKVERYNTRSDASAENRESSP